MRHLLGERVLSILDWVRAINHPLLRKLLGIAIVLLLLLLALPFYLLSKPWSRIGLYILIALLTRFIFEPGLIDWQQVQSRARDWAGMGVLIGVFVNLPFFLFMRFSNTGNFLVDVTVTAIDETRSSEKSEFERTWLPFVILLCLAIIGGILGATTVLLNAFRLPNVIVVMALACLDLIATATQRKIRKGRLVSIQ